MEIVGARMLFREPMRGTETSLTLTAFKVGKCELLGADSTAVRHCKSLVPVVGRGRVSGLQALCPVRETDDLG